MAFFLLELTDTNMRVNGVHSMIVEAADATKAKEIASSKTDGDAAWSGATATTLSTGLAADLEGFEYRVKVVDPEDVFHPLFDVTYTAIEADTPTTVAAALVNLLSGRAIANFTMDDGGVLTDDTTDANDAGTDDVTILPTGVAQADAAYFGSSFQFDKITLLLSTQGAGDHDGTWEYWDGEAWTALEDVVDGTTIFTHAAGKVTVTFTRPLDWETTDVGDATGLYFVRFVLDESGDVTTAPKATQMWVGGGLLASNSAGTLTVAAIADGIGDHQLVVTGICAGCETPANGTLIGAIVDEGIAGAVLSVVIATPSPIPFIVQQFGKF